MYGGGREPFYQAGALRHGKIRIEYQNRLRELRDLLFNPEQTGVLIEEYTSLIATRHGALTFAEADRRKWDYHPIHTSPHAMGGMKTRPGLYYTASPSGDIFGMAQLMKRYVGTRGRQLDQRWLANPSLPPKPKLTADSIPKTASESARVRCEVNSDGAPMNIQWRLGDVTPPGKAPNRKRHPGNYEVATLWSTNGPTAVEIPPSVLRPGHTYRLRARFQDANGASGHYSLPVQFTVAP